MAPPGPNYYTLTKHLQALADALAAAHHIAAQLPIGDMPNQTLAGAALTLRSQLSDLGVQAEFLTRAIRSHHAIVRRGTT